MEQENSDNVQLSTSILQNLLNWNSDILIYEKLVLDILNSVSFDNFFIHIYNYPNVYAFLSGKQNFWKKYLIDHDLLKYIDEVYIEVDEEHNSIYNTQSCNFYINYFYETIRICYTQRKQYFNAREKSSFSTSIKFFIPDPNTIPLEKLLMLYRLPYNNIRDVINREYYYYILFDNGEVNLYRIIMENNMFPMETSLHSKGKRITQSINLFTNIKQIVALRDYNLFLSYDGILYIITNTYRLNSDISVQTLPMSSQSYPAERIIEDENWYNKFVTRENIRTLPFPFKIKMIYNPESIVNEQYMNGLTIIDYNDNVYLIPTTRNIFSSGVINLSNGMDVNLELNRKLFDFLISHPLLTKDDFILDDNNINISSTETFIPDHSNVKSNTLPRKNNVTNNVKNLPIISYNNKHTNVLYNLHTDDENSNHKNTYSNPNNIIFVILIYYIDRQGQIRQKIYNNYVELTDDEYEAYYTELANDDHQLHHNLTLNLHNPIEYSNDDNNDNSSNDNNGNINDNNGNNHNNNSINDNGDGYYTDIEEGNGTIIRAFIPKLHSIITISSIDNNPFKIFCLSKSGLIYVLGRNGWNSYDTEIKRIVNIFKHNDVSYMQTITYNKDDGKDMVKLITFDGNDDIISTHLLNIPLRTNILSNDNFSGIIYQISDINDHIFIPYSLFLLYSTQDNIATEKIKNNDILFRIKGMHYIFQTTKPDL